MRYSLRNQHKISAAYGEKFLQRVLTSLDEAFKEGKPKPEEHTLQGEDYPVIDINDEGHTCGIILLYIINKTFDVYNLAFKEVIN